jgi:hypothetical protein
LFSILFNTSPFFVISLLPPNVLHVLPLPWTGDHQLCDCCSHNPPTPLLARRLLAREGSRFNRSARPSPHTIPSGTHLITTNGCNVPRGRDSSSSRVVFFLSLFLSPTDLINPALPRHHRPPPLPRGRRRPRRRATAQQPPLPLNPALPNLSRCFPPPPTLPNRPPPPRRAAPPPPVRQPPPDLPLTPAAIEDPQPPQTPNPKATGLHHRLRPPTSR